MFTHEKFEAYQLSIKFNALTLNILEEMPAGYSGLKDQLRRAAFSIPLNIAEGTGKTGRADRRRFYSIARGSAMECAAICDLIGLLDCSAGTKAQEAKGILRSIVGILSAVCFDKET